MEIKNDFSEIKIVIENLDKDKEEIIEKWLKKEYETLFSKKRFDAKSKAILKIFGMKILEHQFDIITEDKTGIFDTVTLIMDYFLKKKFTIIDMYQYYSELKNVTLFYYINKYPELKDKIYYKLANLFDRNFILFINEFSLDILNHKDDEKEEDNEITKEINNEEVANKLETRKKDIRFTKRDSISAVEFVNDFDDTVFDKVNSMLEDTNTFIVSSYSLDDSNDTKNSKEIVNYIIGYLDEIPEFLNFLEVFEIIERAFGNLVEFLSSITEEMLKDKEKRVLLVNLISSLIEDFENWLKVVFLEKSAQDIHYFDASFSANILKIENIFNKNDEEEECEIDFF